MMVKNSLLKFIGTGCWQGTPAPFTDDKISKKVNLGEKDFRFRTSLVLKSKKGNIVMFEMSPDIRLQSWYFKLPKPEAFFVTHWHHDHLYGLLELDWYSEKYGLKLNVNKFTSDWIDKNMGHIPNKEINIFKTNSKIDFEEFTIYPLEVNHVDQTHGFKIVNNETKKSISYIPDMNGLNVRTLDAINSSDYVVLDATYLESNLVDDQTHFNHDQLLKFIKDEIKGPQIILTNIGSFSGLDHLVLQNKYNDFIISYDGLEIGI